MKWVKNSSRIKIIIAVFTILFSVLLLGGSMAAFINPAHLWPAAFAGLFFPVLLLPVLVFFVYWLIRRGTLCILPLVCLLIASFHIPNYIGLKSIFTPSAQSGRQKIKVMSWNMRYFQPLNGEGKPHRTAMLNVIRRVKPDILCVQEYYDRTNSKENLTDSICQILGSRNFFFRAFKFKYSGMAIFSKYPISDTGLVQIAPLHSSNQCIFADVTINNKPLRIYNVHLYSSNLPQMASKNAAYYKGISGELKKYGSALKRLKNAFVYRSGQVATVKSHIASSPLPVILAGDLNETPASYTYRQLSAGLQNTFTQKGSGIGKTHWGEYPDVQIDYIFTAPTFDILNYKVMYKQLSDHYPVVTEIAWK